MNTLDFVDQTSLRDDIPDFSPGDTVNVHVKVIEGSKERIQVFKGVVHPPSGRRDPRDLHRSQGKLRRGCRADLPGAFARTSTTSTSPPAAMCVARSSTTCASCVARRRRSRRSADSLGPAARARRSGEHRPGYADAVTGPTDSADPSPERTLDTEGSDTPDADGAESDSPKRKGGALREAAILVTIALVLYYIMLTFVARPYLIPSESMEPTLHGCTGCVGDRIMVDKLTYRFGEPQPGDVVVFKGPPSWNVGYKSIRSDNTARAVDRERAVVHRLCPTRRERSRQAGDRGWRPDRRVPRGHRAHGRRQAPLDEPYLDPATMMADPKVYPCLGNEFGPVKVPDGRLWVMGDNRTHSADSRAHCTNTPDDAQRGLLCTGDPTAGTIPVDNVIGKARFIAWPPSRWGGVGSVNPQTQ